MGTNKELELPKNVRWSIEFRSTPLRARVFSDCKPNDLIADGPENEVIHGLAVKQLEAAIVAAVTPKQLAALRYHIEKATSPTSQITGLTLFRLAKEMGVSREDVRILSYRGLRNVRKLLNSRPDLLDDL